MKLYLIGSIGMWAGTQEKARAACKAMGEDGFYPIDVPTDKPGLLEFLNSHAVCRAENTTCKGGTDEQPVPSIERDAPGAVNADAMLEWLFDHAEPRHVERIFEALGTRFHEMRKAHDHA